MNFEVAPSSIWSAVVILLLGGGAALSIRRLVLSYRDVKSGKLDDSGEILSRLKEENVRYVDRNSYLERRLETEESEHEKTRKSLYAEQLRTARLEVELIRRGGKAPEESDG